MHIKHPHTVRNRLLATGAAVLLLGVGYVAGSVAAQPHMENALHALQNAHNQLEQAAADKAGHRVNAMHLIEQAIGEVQAGIAAGS